MTSTTMHRLSGIGNILGAVFLLFFWYGFVLFLPYGKLTDNLSLLVLQPAWIPLNLFGVIGTLMVMLSLPGTWSFHRQKGTIAMLLTLLGSSLLLGPMLWDTLLWKTLARHDSNLLRFDGPIYQSPAFLPFFVSAGLVWASGYVAFGQMMRREGKVSLLAAWAIMIGAPFFALGSLFGKAQAIPRSIGITLFSFGLISIGWKMWKEPTENEAIEKG